MHQKFLLSLLVSLCSLAVVGCESTGPPSDSMKEAVRAYIREEPSGETGASTPELKELKWHSVRINRESFELTIQSPDGKVTQREVKPGELRLLILEFELGGRSGKYYFVVDAESEEVREMIPEGEWAGSFYEAVF